MKRVGLANGCTPNSLPPSNWPEHLSLPLAEQQLSHVMAAQAVEICPCGTNATSKEPNLGAQTTWKGSETGIVAGGTSLFKRFSPACAPITRDSVTMEHGIMLSVPLG